MGEPVPGRLGMVLFYQEEEGRQLEEERKLVVAMDEEVVWFGLSIRCGRQSSKGQKCFISALFFICQCRIFPGSLLLPDIFR